MLFFIPALLLVVVALSVGFYLAFTDKTPELLPVRPFPRFHPSLDYLDARRKAFEVHVEIDK